MLESKNTRSSVLALLLPLVLVATTSLAQIKRPVTWYTQADITSSDRAVITMTAIIEEPFHIYSIFQEEGGPVPTSFSFESSGDYELVGKVKEMSEPVEKFDNTFLMPVIWLEGTAVFTQEVKLIKNEVTVQGEVTYMACTDMECLLPVTEKLSVKIVAPKKESETQKLPEKSSGKIRKTKEREDKNPNNFTDSTEPENGGQSIVTLDAHRQVQEIRQDSLQSGSKNILTVNGDNKKMPPSLEDPQQPIVPDSLLAIFVAGFLGGLAAFLMPCVFPMVPFIIGSFSKRGQKSNSVGLSLIFGTSIIVIYVTLGLLITLLFGSDALNDLSTNGIFNLFFFFLLVVFAASFLGAFELSLPARWVNKVDAQADRNGLTGIFFMAATLALVSFSCTGPIIGTLLVETARMGRLLGPLMGMAGFSLALALPFTLFAMFPSWLKSLPKSGSWMNSMKVVLGFLELALALKFLSNVDLAYHWEWFDREVFLVLWIIIFGCLGFYLLGKIRLQGDAESVQLSPVRLFFAIVTLAFTLYLIPGLWGAPLKSVAAFLPPQHTQDFDLYTNSFQDINSYKVTRVSNQKKKYDDIFHAPLNLNTFFDYEEGLAFANEINKPVLIDFTGHACVNCRKMEATVWPERQVLKLLKEHYVVIQLYVDDKTELPVDEQYMSPYSGKMIKTIGNKWSDLQASAFNSNSQPYYVLLDHSANLLGSPSGAVYDAEQFAEFLLKGVNEFESRQ